jgi:hypothetical protein
MQVSLSNDLQKCAIQHSKGFRQENVGLLFGGDDSKEIGAFIGAAIGATTNDGAWDATEGSDVGGPGGESGSSTADGCIVGGLGSRVGGRFVAVASVTRQITFKNSI